MKILKKVEFDEVMRLFRLEHDVNREHEANTNRDAERLLMIANTELGEWSKVLLSRDDILQVILPMHECHEGINTNITPKSGLTVKQAVEKLSSIKDSYAKNYPVCWSKILTLERFTTLFLSTKPTSHEEYVEIDKEGLVHLDGWHRMVGWELNGLLTNDTQLETYVAGNLESYV
ncbi:MAG: DUF6309 family protein [Rhizonema sp. PD37]|nr:DUF6309 family protein [Rhizonema sp. PD37]